MRSSVFPRNPPFPVGEMFCIVFLFHEFDGLGLASGDLYTNISFLGLKKGMKFEKQDLEYKRQL